MYKDLRLPGCGERLQMLLCYVTLSICEQLFRKKHYKQVDLV